MRRTPISQHWINWNDKTLKAYIAIVWEPEAPAAFAEWKAGEESWRVYDFIEWCVRHKETIEALRKEERAASVVSEGVRVVSGGSGGGVGVPVFSDGRRAQGCRLGIVPERHAASGGRGDEYPQGLIGD